MTGASDILQKANVDVGKVSPLRYAMLDEKAAEGIEKFPALASLRPKEIRQRYEPE